MKARRSSSGAGERLKALRMQMRLTTRDVEKLSMQIADAKRNPEYYLSHAWLTEIESGEFTPSIYKLYTLSTIYHSRFTEMLGYFGLNLSDTSADVIAVRMPKTHILSRQQMESPSDLRVPAQLIDDSGLNQTKALPGQKHAWHKLPLGVLQHLSSRDTLYGYVGLQDFTLFPLIRPGSFVEIDSSQNKIRPLPWTGEYDRPIYFVELREGYVCSWCQLDNRQLSIVPHPVSRQQIRTFRYPDEAEIVGRVTAVAMRIVPLDEQGVPEGLKTSTP